MELIVISDNKLKIMMSKKDMEAYGLDENEFYCSISNTREILDKILHNSPIRTGFENTSIYDKILFQLYPDKNGGCELYVTKLTLDEKEDELFMPQENDNRYLLPKQIQKKQAQDLPLISYCFAALEHATRAAKELNKRNYEGASSFYRDCDGKYFLFVNTSKNEYVNDKATIDLLSEFGEVVNAEHSRLFLAERGRCVFKEKAVQQLAEI